MPDTILFPFEITNIGTLSKTDNIEESINSLFTFILSTKENEFLGSPDLGSKLHFMVFETNRFIIDGMSKFYIEEAVRKFMSDIIAIKDVRGEIDELDNTKYNIYVEYEIITSGEEKTFVYPINITA